MAETPEKQETRIAPPTMQAAEQAIGAKRKRPARTVARAAAACALVAALAGAGVGAWVLSNPASLEETIAFPAASQAPAAGAGEDTAALAAGEDAAADAAAEDEDADGGAGSTATAVGLGGGSAAATSGSADGGSSSSSSGSTSASSSADASSTSGNTASSSKQAAAPSSSGGTAGGSSSDSTGTGGSGAGSQASTGGAAGASDGTGSAGDAGSGDGSAAASQGAASMQVTFTVDASRAGSAYSALSRETTLSLAQGATAYDALVASGMAVGGNETYVSSIGGLAEFACGRGSGWLYSVNGEFPNKSCGKYVLSEGDVLAWVYTCDMGKDV